MFLLFSNRYLKCQLGQRIQSNRDEILGRICLRIIILPSGKELSSPISTPAGALSFGKLLYGGVTRYRMIGGGKNKRKVGERTEIYSAHSKSWLQYGGPIRTYQAVDMGPCALLELTMLPKSLFIPSLEEEFDDMMTVTKFPLNPETIFDFTQDIDKTVINKVINQMSDRNKGNNISISTTNYLDNVESSLQVKVGGLSKEVEEIVRRVVDGRIVKPDTDEGSTSFDRSRSQEAQLLLDLGLHPVKGLLLYGPPGCGKTALAREISSRLDTVKPPKIVSAPELLDRYVGGSEKLVRSLFADAVLEFKNCNGDGSKSALHVIIIDEIDAVFRKRSAAEDSGEVTRASAVNQILSILDGVNSPNNILVIGMTNRRELLDEALLRPGRLEVQIYIPFPNQDSRREILQIHFDALRRKGRLSTPLCEAIDGVRRTKDSNKLFVSQKAKRDFFFAPLRGMKIKDLAAEQWTGGFSGADIAGLVRSAGSLALERVRRNDESLENFMITLEDVWNALKEVNKT
jgi:vesicle-fusing ATPase